MHQHPLSHTSASHLWFPCPPESFSVHSCLLFLTLVCAITYFRTQAPHTYRSRVRQHPLSHTSASHLSLPCAPESFSVHSCLLFLTLVCTSTHFRTQVTHTYRYSVRWSPSPATVASSFLLSYAPAPTIDKCARCDFRLHTGHGRKTYIIDCQRIEKP